MGLATVYCSRNSGVTECGRVVQHPNRVPHGTMSTKQTPNEKCTDRIDRQYHDVPESWLRGGSDADPDADERLFEATAVCVERFLHTEPDGRNALDVSESGAIYVLYQHEATGDTVERRYEASLVENGSNLVIVPRCVRKGGAEKFAASIAVAEEDR